MIIKISLSEEKKSGFVQSTDKDTAAKRSKQRRSLTSCGRISVPTQQRRSVLLSQLLKLQGERHFRFSNITFVVTITASGLWLFAFDWKDESLSYQGMTEHSQIITCLNSVLFRKLKV